jgi:hypothetical protein
VLSLPGADPARRGCCCLDSVTMEEAQYVAPIMLSAHSIQQSLVIPVNQPAVSEVGGQFPVQSSDLPRIILGASSLRLPAKHRARWRIAG